MTTPESRALEERVAQLEARVETLQTLVRQLAEAADRRPAAVRTASTVRPAAVGTATTKPSKPAATRLVPARGSEFWLNRIGIALVLLGVVFLFKYAVDQGWLTPWVRVLVGLAVGGALYALGFRLRNRRGWFAASLLGAAIGAFYISGFAAFQLYGLVSHGLAYTFMVAVSVLALSTAWWAEEAALSVIGVAGALATPFLLYDGVRNVPGLMTYTAIVVTAAAMIYFVKGWPALLWTAAVGGWAVLFVPLADLVASNRDRWSMVAAALVTWIGSWAVPAVREGLVMTRPDRWRRPPMPRRVERHVEALAIAVPLILLLHVASVWALESATAGWLAMLGAAVYAAAAWGLRAWRTDERLWYAHAAASVVLLTVGLGLLLRDGWLLAAWAVEVAVLHAVARVGSHRATAAGANVLFTIVTVWLFGRLALETGRRPAIVTVPAALDLVTIGAAFAAAHVMPPDPSARGRPLGAVIPTKAAYQLVAYVAGLAWIWRELSVLPNGNGLVTVAWGVVGAGLLVTALLRRHTALRRVALGTLLAVVGKLFLVDLASVEALWRIMLFLGFGAIFLVLSYFFRDLWQDATDTTST